VVSGCLRTGEVRPTRIDNAGGVAATSASSNDAIGRCKLLQLLEPLSYLGWREDEEYSSRFDSRGLPGVRDAAALNGVAKEIPATEINRWSIASDTPVGRLRHLDPTVQLSEAPPRWPGPRSPRPSPAGLPAARRRGGIWSISASTQVQGAGYQAGAPLRAELGCRARVTFALCHFSRNCSSPKPVCYLRRRRPRSGSGAVVFRWRNPGRSCARGSRFCVFRDSRDENLPSWLMTRASLVKPG
jgi:hypothetical protein